MFKALTILFAFFCFTHLSFAQNWPKFYPFEQFGFATKMIETYDGGLAMICSKFEPQTYNKCYFVKADANGNLLWYKKIGIHENEYLNNIIQTRDSGYIIIGSSHGETLEQYGSMMLKLNACAEQEWCRVYYDSTIEIHNDRLEKIEELPNGDLVVGFSSGQHVAIAKLNGDNGKVIWMHNTNYFKHRNINVLPDNSILIAATGYTTVNGSVMGYGNVRSGAFKLDSDGHLIWNRVYGQQNNLLSGEPSCIFLDEYYYLVNTKINPGNSDTNDVLQIIRFNEEGKILDHNEFGRPVNNEGVTGLHLLNNGNLLVHSYLYPTKANYTERVKLYQITPLGSLIYEKEYATDSTRFASLLSTQDANGNILLAGARYFAGSGELFMNRIKPNLESADSNSASFTYDYLCNKTINSDTIVLQPSISYIKLDTLINNPFDSFTNISLSTNQLTVNEIIKAYPNPTNASLTLTNLQNKYLRIEVYNSQGLLVDNFEIPKDTEFYATNTTSYTNGVYFFKVINAETYASGTVKIIKLTN